MPIYEYSCNDCGHHFDALRSMKDADTLIECKNCHSTHTKRIPSLCFSHSDGREAFSAHSGCSGCSGGSCSSCGH